MAARTGGVLPISITQHKNASRVNGTTGETAKLQNVKHKVVIRSIPPNVAQAELEQALGEEWKAGSKRVAWSSFKAGKASKEYVHA